MLKKKEGRDNNFDRLETTGREKKTEINSWAVDPRNEIEFLDMIFLNRISSEWLNTKEAASYLSVSPNALRIMVCRRRVEAYQMGSRLRFRVDDLRALLSKKGIA